MSNYPIVVLGYLREDCGSLGLKGRFLVEETSLKPPKSVKTELSVDSEQPQALTNLLLCYGWSDAKRWYA